MYELDGASEIHVQNVADALRALADGEKYKKFAKTEMNARSSRAHSIFMLTLVQRHAGTIKRSTLHLCDLGGSEQVKRSKAVGERLLEAVYINMSLMTLGRVIDALVHRRAHVPFYESQLTMLLQPSLVGAQTTVVVCASPDDIDSEETLHALRFGERAASITSSGAVVNTASMAEVVASLDAQIEAVASSIAELGGDVTLKAQIEAEKSDAKLRGLGYGHGASRLEARGHTDGSGGGREAELVGGQRARTEAELRAGTGSAYTQVETRSLDRSDTFNTTERYIDCTHYHTSLSTFRSRRSRTR